MGMSWRSHASTSGCHRLQALGDHEGWDPASRDGLDALRQELGIEGRRVIDFARAQDLQTAVADVVVETGEGQTRFLNPRVLDVVAQSFGCGHHLKLEFCQLVAQQFANLDAVPATFHSVSARKAGGDTGVGRTVALRDENGKDVICRAPDKAVGQVVLVAQPARQRGEGSEVDNRCLGR